MNTFTSDNGYEIGTEMFNQANKVYNDFSNRHSRTMFVRFDLHYEDGSTNGTTNRNISRCMNEMRKHFKRKCIDSAYIWTREQNKANSPHYHCSFILDGNKSQSPYAVYCAAEHYWQKTIGSDKKGLVNHCNKDQNRNPRVNGEVIHRGEKPDYIDKQISYQCKALGKGEEKDGLRDFGTSRISKKS